MQYKKIGKWGIKISELSFGSWVTFGKQINQSSVKELMKVAYDSGVTFFDNAEFYAKGEAELLMGAALKSFDWPRDQYVISTKFYFGIQDKPHLKKTLNRKYLLGAIDGSLKRLGLEYVDVVYCHRPDPETPLEETVYAMHDIVQRGKAVYWGTSEWSAENILAACKFADKYGLHKPIVEQPQYHIFWRERVEKEYRPVFKETGMGSTTWSPLASGLLTGKYKDLVPPKGTRLALDGYEWLKEKFLTAQNLERVKKIEKIANDLGVSLAQFSIAWCLKNSNVTSVILGATKVEQLKENLGAVEVVNKINDEIMKEVEKVKEASGLAVG